MNNKLIKSTIIENLSRNGASRVEELYKSVNKIHSDLDEQIFDKTLMIMELQGIIRVFSLTRNKRRVELVKG